MKRIVMLSGLVLLLSFSFACSTINYELLVYDQPSPVKRQYVPIDDGDFFFARGGLGRGQPGRCFFRRRHGGII